MEQHRAHKYAKHTAIKLRYITPNAVNHFEELSCTAESHNIRFKSIHIYRFHLADSFFGLFMSMRRVSFYHRSNHVYQARLYMYY